MEFRRNKVLGIFSKKNGENTHSLLSFQNKMLDTAVVWIVTIDPNGNITMWNRAAEHISGYSKEEALGNSKIFEMLYPDKKYNNEIRNKFSGSLNEGLSLENYETEIVTKNGSIKNISWNANPLVDEFGNNAGILALGFDVTANKKIERELHDALNRAEEANKLKSVLLSNISHELRTPMNGIIGFSGILKAELHVKIFQEMAAKIYDSSKRLMNTFNSILSLAELESGSVKFKEELLDVAVCTRTLLIQYENKIKEKELDHNLIVKDKHIFAKAEEDLYKRILSNLIDNAIKFTQKGSLNIEIDSEKNGNTIFAIIRVVDTGIGIKAEHLEDIFEEFKQLSEGFNRQYEGSGLGLTIARKTSRLIGGEISVESEYGKGSVFVLKLPGLCIEETNIESEKVYVHKVSDTAVSSLPAILLVEDNQINQDIIQIYLETNYDVDIVSDGKSAIKKAGIKKYSAILMDINLGADIDGIESAEQIKNIPLNQSTPIIAVTGYTPTSINPHFRKEICSGYLLKPFMKEEILTLLKKLI